MLRRHAIASLFAAAAWGKAHDGAVVLHRKTRRVLVAQMPDLAGPPGSTLKPLVLQTLMEHGRLHAEEAFPCPGDLRLDGRNFACRSGAGAFAGTTRELSLLIRGLKGSKRAALSI